jgi:hypothetical protein
MENTLTEKELREKISNEVDRELTYALENCACLGRDAYGDYIKKMVQMVKNKIKGK